MMTHISTKSVRKEFLNAISTADRIYGPVRHNCVWNYESINESTFHPRVAFKVVGLAFLSVVAAWEEYLENSFLRYMTGAKSESLYSPKMRIGKCKSTTHALQVLTGVIKTNDAARFSRWNDYDWVTARASIFFQKGEPYSLISSRFQQRLKDAQIIRNRVAHSSLKARHQFKRMVNLNVGEHPNSPLDFGFSPGKYLVFNKPEIIFDKSWVDSKDCYWPDIFECYVHMFIEIIDIITPN
jgi:hypothetical protein